MSTDSRPHPVTKQILQQYQVTPSVPPDVPPLSENLFARASRQIAAHRERRQIAQELIEMAIIYHGLGFEEARNQLLHLAGFGLTKQELKDLLERGPGRPAPMQMERSNTGPTLDQPAARRSSGGVSLRKKS